MPELVETSPIQSQPPPPSAPNKPMVWGPFRRVLVGVLVGAVVGAEVAWSVLMYYLAIVVQNFQPFVVLVWQWLPAGGLLGAAGGVLGGLCWGRWVRTVLGTVVTAMLGGLLGVLVAWYSGVVNIDSQIWLAAWIGVGGVIGGYHCWFEGQRRKRRQ